MRVVEILKKDGTREDINAYNIADFPYSNLNSISKKCKHKKNRSYLTNFATFDIETTTIEDYSQNPQPFGFMYHWQMCVNGICVYGRTWSEWVVFLYNLIGFYKINNNKRFVIYVHNLSYEFQFIKDVLQDEFGDLDVFATDKRKVLRFSTNNGLEFRCSYRLSNMSLNSSVLNEKGVEHIKAIGDLDYTLFRDKDTYLNDIEFGYCVSDVLCLWEFIKCRLKNDRDDLESIPFTSTGYVRRDMRNSCRKNPKYFDFFKSLAFDSHLYLLMLDASRGGNCHANYRYAGRIWHSSKNNGIYSADAVSEYPFQLFRKFPITKFQFLGDIADYEELKKLIKTRPCIFRAIIENPKLRESVTIPYIPEDKCSKLRGGVFDNGRVLEAELLEIALTDVDYKLIERQYEFKSIIVYDFYVSTYGYLPPEILTVVKKYFVLKCELKEKINKCDNEEEKKELLYLYGKIKNKLNGIFGMMYTHPVQNEKKYDCKSREWYEEAVDFDDHLKKFFNKRNNFAPFFWGVWVTAYGREWLQQLVDCVDNNGGRTMYSDTDSDKFIGTKKTLKAIEDLNEKIKDYCEKVGAYSDVDGKRFYLGFYDIENKEPLKSFCTLGAKKYCYEDKDGLHLTISGVDKEKGAKELGDIEKFKPGFIFKDAGGINLWYNDYPEARQVEINGEKIKINSNIGMLNGEYTLGITEEYGELIGLNIYELFLTS